MTRRGKLAPRKGVAKSAAAAAAKLSPPPAKKKSAPSETRTRTRKRLKTNIDTDTDTVFDSVLETLLYLEGLNDANLRGAIVCLRKKYQSAVSATIDQSATATTATATATATALWVRSRRRQSKGRVHQEGGCQKESY